MAIVITCAACNTRLTLGDDRAGDRFECPQCEAMIKVPLGDQPPAQAPKQSAPSAKPARTTRPEQDEPNPEPDPESAQGPDKRVLIGIIAGIAALLLVGVLGTVLAFRKPAETAKRDAEPATPAAAPVSTPPAPVALAPSPTKSEPAPPKPAFGIPPIKAEPVLPVYVAPPVDPSNPQFNAQFLGSQAQGRRFCIIADNSGSMSGAKIADLKVQLLKTLTDLNRDGEFYVYFFNSNAEPMPHPTWLKAGAPEVEKVRTWVSDCKSRGGTNPVPAFEAAFKLSPPPDVIFFMTDGIFANTAPPRIAALNGTPPKTVVNTIMFLPPTKGAVPPKFAIGGEDQLKLIATQAGGKFTLYAPKE